MASSTEFDEKRIEVSISTDLMALPPPPLKPFTLQIFATVRLVIIAYCVERERESLIFGEMYP